MWQRVQTLYLAIATGLLVAMFFCAKATVAGDGEAVRFTTYIPYLILMIVCTALDFLALTTWKRRIFQMRTAVLAALVSIGLQAWLAVDFFATKGEVIFTVAAVFPVVAAIFDFLAARNILADEMMVRSASRLRGRKR